VYTDGWMMFEFAFSNVVLLLVCCSHLVGQGLVVVVVRLFASGLEQDPKMQIFLSSLFLDQFP